MIKYGIKSKNNNDVLIFHALPNEITISQWYITESSDSNGSLIEGQKYESITLTAEIIKEKNYEGKYLYCEYLALGSSLLLKTECVKIGSNIDEMLNDGTIFDNISKFDEQGNIVKL